MEKSSFKSWPEKRERTGRLSAAEIMTIIIHFHHSGFRTFKQYYCCYVKLVLKHFFPRLVTYERFVILMKSVMVPLSYFLHTLTGEKTGIYFIDSTIIKACHIKREKQTKVFSGYAKKGKSTMGYYTLSRF